MSVCLLLLTRRGGCAERRDQKFRGDDAVLRGESGSKIIGIQKLCVGRKLIIALPDQHLHMIGA